MGLPRTYNKIIYGKYQKIYTENFERRKWVSKNNELNMIQVKYHGISEVQNLIFYQCKP